MNEEILRSAETASVEEDLLSAETAPLESIVEQETEIVQEPVTEELVSPDITHRLAEEFFCLREEFPDLRSPEQLPDAVLDMAVDNNISLLDAYLRFRHDEDKRMRQEEERRRAAAARSAGSLVQGTDQSHPEQEAFLRAFRTALK